MITMKEALEEFTLTCQANGLKKLTLDWYGSRITAMIRHFDDANVNDISTKDMRKYIVKLRQRDTRYENASNKPPQKGGLSQDTINGHIRALHRFWLWASNEYDIQNPMKGIQRPPQPKPNVKAVQPLDIMKLLEACGDDLEGIRNKAMIAFMAEAGVRRGGVVDLRLSQLDLTNGQAIVTEKDSKSRTVFFSVFTSSLIKRYLEERNSDEDQVFLNIRNGQPLRESGVNQLLKRLKARAGITGRVNPHSIRHGFAVSFIQSGGDLSVLAKLLGHSDVSTTFDYYLIFTNDELKQLHGENNPLKFMQKIATDNGR